MRSTINVCWTDEGESRVKVCDYARIFQQIERFDVKKTTTAGQMDGKKAVLKKS